MDDIFIHHTAIVEKGAQIGAGTRIWHFCHIMPGAVIGRNCSLGQNVFVGKGVVMGNGVKVQNNVSIYEGVICEDDVFLGPSVVFTNIKNPRSAISRKGQYQKTYLEKGVSIGANSTLICGIRLGKHAFVGAGSVITKNILAYELWLGNPARHNGWVSEYGHRLTFDKSGEATCPESGQKYRRLTTGVERISQT